MADLPPEVEAAAAGRQPFEIADHGAPCCVLARTWLEGLDATYHRGAASDAPPAWVAERFPPGPATEDLHWCEIPDAAVSELAAAALARELWRLRCEGVCAVQLVARDLSYREAIGHEGDGRLQVWDRTTWLRPRPGGPALAIRVTGGRAALPQWGEHRLPRGEWTAI